MLTLQLNFISSSLRAKCHVSLDKKAVKPASSVYSQMKLSVTSHHLNHSAFRRHPPAEVLWTRKECNTQTVKVKVRSVSFHFISAVDMSSNHSSWPAHSKTVESSRVRGTRPGRSMASMGGGGGEGECGSRVPGTGIRTYVLNFSTITAAAPRHC